ncbi:hypothetical protein F5051DRAFT_414657 [Lentinula edodes]|nr:hypothetical protein F5051DRAFT_414657 [Lentinula edodes]
MGPTSDVLKMIMLSALLLPEIHLDRQNLLRTFYSESYLRELSLQADNSNRIFEAITSLGQQPQVVLKVSRRFLEKISDDLDI